MICKGDNDNDKDKGHSFRQLSVQKALACPEGQICEVLHKPQLGYSFEPTSNIDILRPARSAALVLLKTGGGARCTRTTLKATSSSGPQTPGSSSLITQVRENEGPPKISELLEVLMGKKIASVKADAEGEAPSRGPARTKTS